MSYGASWGVWWGLSLERPAWASLSPDLIRDQERDGLLPAGSAAQLGGVIVGKRGRGTLRPELVVTAGPQRLAQPGGGTFAELYGGRWALGLYKGGPRLYQAQGGVWVDRSDPAALADLTGARHIALSWDQAARPVVAWERDALVYVRQWSAALNAYVTRGPWPGCDPVLTCDAVLMYQTADSDVLLWHLTPDRAALAYRVQRELYAVARVSHDYGEPVVLDQLVPHPYRAQLLAQDSAGRLRAVTVGLYPVAAVGGAAALVSGPAAGDLFEVVIVREGEGAALMAVSGPAGGDLFEVVIVRENSGAALMEVSGPDGGLLFDAVTVRENSGAALMAVSGPGGGELFDAVATHSQPAEPVTAGVSGPSGGALT